MMRSNHKNSKRVRTSRFYRVSQRDGARISAAPAGADSDGKSDLFSE